MFLEFCTYKLNLATFLDHNSIITKFIDQSIEDMKTKPQDSSDEESVLEKLLKIDKRVAIIMALDMLMAGVDTVRIKSFDWVLKP